MYRIILLVYILLQGVQCAKWTTTSPPDGQIIYRCRNDGVTLSWEYELAVGDRVNDVKWIYKGSSKEIIAALVHERFFPLANFSNRVSLVGNAGISLSKVQVADSGNYYVEVQVLGNGDSSESTLLRTVTLIVSDGLMTKDGMLHAVQDEEAVLDPSTGQWSIQLSCGAFLHQDTPPFSVQWLRGATVVNSTSYSHHHFHLILKNPVQGETYTCRIPPQNAADVCLQGKSSQAKAAVTVNQNDARHSLVMKELQVLKQQDQFQKDQIQSLMEEQEKEKLKTNKLSAVVYKMQNESRQPVAFHAVQLLHYSYSGHAPLIFRTVLYNVGGGYDSTSGYFTAPVAGIYFFAASLGGDQGFRATLTTGNQVTGGELCLIYGSNGRQHATAHALIRLGIGQRVWLMSEPSLIYNTGFASVFSGFLLTRDV